MNAEKQRVAIAGACGWTDIRDYNGYPHGFFGKEAFDGIPPIPDYPNSLDAMHEAEKVFKDCEIQWHTYRHQLMRLIEAHRHELHATASQKAEAFLRTLNLWEPAPHD